MNSWCFQPPWSNPLHNFQGLIFAPYAIGMVLSLWPHCLAYLCQEPRAISQPFQMALLWVLRIWASSTLTQQPLWRWDQCPTDADKRIGPEIWQVPCGHPVPWLRKTSTHENGPMIKGREGKGMISMWKKEKYHTKLPWINGGTTRRFKD